MLTVLLILIVAMMSNTGRSMPEDIVLKTVLF